MASPTIRFKRGAFANLPSLLAGEPGFTTDRSDFYVGGGPEGNKFFGSARYWEREDGASSAVLKLVNAAGSGSVNLKTPDGHSGVTTYIFPSAPAAGYFLKTNATGTLEWASVTDGATFDAATLSNTTFTGISTFSGPIDATDLDVSGIGTIATADINGGNIDGTVIGGSSAAAGTFTQLNYDNSSTSGISTVGELYVGTTQVLYDNGGVITLAGIQTVDATTIATLETLLSLDPNDFDTLNVSGIGTFGGLLDANAGLDVTGHSELDDLNVSGVSTFSGALNANGNVSIGNSTSDTLTVDAAATFNQLITGAISGNAGTATSLATGRNIAVSGIVTGTAYFDGTADITIDTTIQNNVIGLGTHTYGDYVADVTAGGGLTKSSTLGEGQSVDLAVGAGTGITVNANDVQLKNSGELTNNRLLKWDNTGGQVANSTISDTGSLVTVSNALTVTGNATVNGNLTVNGTTVQVNTTELAVYDRTITLGIQTGTTPVDTSWDLGVLMNYGEAGIAKTAGFVWDFATKRFQFASDANNPAVGVNTTTPDITVSAFAPIEVGGLWVNNACSGGVQEVIGCSDGVLSLMNVVVDGGAFA